MGRKREFDIDLALQIATELFWRKGYDATSLSDLTATIGITAPSFYFAFHSKELLFKQVVERYQQEQGLIVTKALGQQSVAEIIEYLLYGFADMLTDPKRAPGCLVMNNALPVTEDHPFRKWFAEQRQALRHQLRVRFAEVKIESQTFDPDTLALFVVSIIWGFAIEAQSGANKQEIHKVVAAVLDMCNLRHLALGD